MAKLADAKRSLQKAKQSAMERLTQLEDERNEIKASVKSLDAALRALQGNAAKTKKKSKSTGDDFARIVDQTLHTIGPSTVAELATAIRQRMEASGASTHKLEARLKAELSEARFVMDGDRVRLHESL